MYRNARRGRVAVRCRITLAPATAYLLALRVAVAWPAWRGLPLVTTFNHMFNINGKRLSGEHRGVCVMLAALIITPVAPQARRARSNAYRDARGTPLWRAPPAFLRQTPPFGNHLGLPTLLPCRRLLWRSAAAAIAVYFTMLTSCFFSVVCGIAVAP